MPKKASPSFSRTEYILLGIILVLIGIFSVFLIRNIEKAKHSGGLVPKNPISDLLLKNKKDHITSIADTEYIDTWMTFQYINFVFNIPENIFKDHFSITDPHYPNIPLGRYIKTGRLDKTTFISEVKKVVRDFMNKTAGIPNPPAK